MGTVVCFKSILLCALIFLLLPSLNKGKRGGSVGSRGKAPAPKINTGHQSSNLGGRGTGGSGTGFGGGSGTGSKNIGGGGFGGGGGGMGRSSYGSLTPSRKTMVAGALGAGVGAFAGYQLGKAVGGHHGYGSWHYGGHTYYYGDRYYHATPNKKKCVFEVDERTEGWNVTDPVEKKLVREIIFECNSYEYCCDMACCRNPDNVHSHRRNVWAWWQTLLVILGLGALFAACAFCLIKQVKKRRMQQENNFTPTSYVEESNKPFVPTNYSDANQSGYYGQQAPYYPPQHQQPYAPAYPSAYPPQPGYGYPPPQQHVYPPPTYQPVPNY